MVLRNISKSCRHGLRRDLWNTNRQAAAVTTEMLYGLGGVVQRGLDIGGGHQVLGSAKHLQHVCLSVVGGQVRFVETR